MSYTNSLEHFGVTLIDIEAQEYAKGFYESVGFKQSSDTFMLDGIPHIKMTRRKHIAAELGEEALNQE